ncbi:hypothetical protein EDD37DRAFT_371348 [Exophiala viscosa]|uniref:uncharacterized protein n=1 Tax=Exophiala viscosa TaxID=2486360 RepID=UPI002192B1DE|nr:hypothetical protein EDD37DRAFT_371348 [Exophiala viscosa]
MFAKLPDWAHQTFALLCFFAALAVPIPTIRLCRCFFTEFTWGKYYPDVRGVPMFLFQAAQVVFSITRFWITSIAGALRVYYGCLRAVTYLIFMSIRLYDSGLKASELAWTRASFEVVVTMALALLIWRQLRSIWDLCTSFFGIVKNMGLLPLRTVVRVWQLLT